MTELLPILGGFVLGVPQPQRRRPSREDMIGATVLGLVARRLVS